MPTISEFFKVASIEASSISLKTAGLSFCGNFDCLGRAIATDAAFRSLMKAGKEMDKVADLQKHMAHTDANELALTNIQKAIDFLRPVSVSPTVWSYSR